MKKILFLFVIASLYLSGCYQDHKSTDMLKNEIQKKEIFLAILNDDQLSSAMTDSFTGLIVLNRFPLRDSTHFAYSMRFGRCSATSRNLRPAKSQA